MGNQIDSCCCGSVTSSARNAHDIPMHKRAHHIAMMQAASTARIDLEREMEEMDKCKYWINYLSKSPLNRSFEHRHL